MKTAHLVHVEDEIQLTDIFKAFIQSFHKHLQQIWTVRHLISAQTFHISVCDLPAGREASQLPAGFVFALINSHYEKLIE